MNSTTIPWHKKRAPFGTLTSPAFYHRCGKNPMGVWVLVNEALKKANEAAKLSFNRTVSENVEAIRQRNIQSNYERYGCKNCPAARCSTVCPRYLTRCETAEFFSWWGKTSPPREMHHKECLPAGVPVLGKGGSKNGKKRKKPVSRATIYSFYY